MVKIDESSSDWKRAAFLIGYVVVLGGGICLLAWMMARDRTHIQEFQGHGWKIEINSGDGDPIFGYHAEVELLRSGKVIYTHLGHSTEEVRYEVVSCEPGIIGITEKERPLELLFVGDSSKGGYWSPHEMIAFTQEGRRMARKLRDATGKNYELREANQSPEGAAGR